jgi:peptide/nickel transport system permease protein
MIAVALLAPFISPYDPNVNRVGPELSGPTWSHWFGTDNFGRDLLSRVVWAARPALFIGGMATVIGLGAATLIGGPSGYFSGIVDYIIQRIVDAAQAIPPLVLLIGLLAIVGGSTFHIILAISALQALALSRVVRGAVISIREAMYLEASRAVGASNLRILVFHVLPNIAPTLLILFSTALGANILLQASLAFLGYGTAPPNPTWGGMITAEGRLYLLLNPWMLVFPVLALSLVVFSANMFGDALRDELDPRLRGVR